MTDIMQALRSVPTPQLIEFLDHNRAALAELPHHVANEPVIQQSLLELMAAELKVVDQFKTLAGQRPEIATRILLSALSALNSLYAVDGVTAELKRRADEN